MRNTRMIRFGALICALAAVLAGCTPAINVYNKSNIDIRVAVFPPGGGMNVVSPSPGESSQVEAPKAGTFTAVAIASQMWLEWARERRDTLSRMLADPRNMSPDLLQKVRQQLQEITARIKQIESMPKDSGSACSATMASSEGEDPFLANLPTGIVEVTMDGSTGKLLISCTTVNPSSSK